MILNPAKDRVTLSDIFCWKSDISSSQTAHIAITPHPHTGTLSQRITTRDRFLRRIGPDSGFHRVFDFMPDVAFFAKDRQFRLVCASRRFFERFGFREESQVIGREDFDLFPPRLAESFRRDDEEVVRTGEPKTNIVELFFTEQGVPDWFITNKLPIRDHTGHIIGVMGTVQSYEHRREVLQPYLQLDRAVAYIRDHFRQGVSVKELAGVLRLSERQLHRKFVEAFGISSQAFIVKLRIQAACEALQHEGSQIAQVASDLGFCDQSSFTQLFQRHVGITPLKYQRRYRLRRTPDH